MHPWRKTVTDLLYVTDLDGTLLTPQVTVSDRSRSILLPLLAEGLPLTAATARTAFSVVPILHGLPFQIPLILQNGAVLYDMQRGQITEAAAIAPDVYLQVLDAFSRYGFNGFVFCVPDTQLLCCYTELSTPHMRRYYQERREQYDKPFQQVHSRRELAGPRPIFLSLNAPKPQLAPLHSALLSIDGISVTFYQDVYETEIWYLEVSAPDATKYHGIQKVRAMTGAKTVIGFGDNHNDLPLFRACDRKIAVGNAAPELRALADEVIGCNTEDAVALYLQAHAARTAQE